MGALAILREAARQKATGDDKFYKKFLYYFELEVPPELALFANNRFITPLVINPQSYSLSEPFAVEVTNTEGGGLYLEEHGIIARTIRLRGHTGFKPRKMHRPVTSLFALKPEQQSFSRALPAFVADNLSGHKHFQYLQDAVFRTYGDLKRDPATAKNTRLYFHVPKDDEHWLVVPQKFDLEREAGKRILYYYNIELLAVAKAEDARADFSEDQGLLDAIRDTIRGVQAAIDLISGAIQDITAIVGELTNFVKDIAKIIDSVTTIIDAASDFVTGVKSFIEAPYALLNSVNEMIDSGMEFLDATEETVDSVRRLPDNIKQKIRQIGDGLEQLGMYPSAFLDSERTKAQAVKNAQSLTTSVSTSRLTEASAQPAPVTIEAFEEMGTTITAGEVQQAKASLPVGQSVPAYTGAREHTIEAGDTLVSLAARYLGDARLWQHIAIANGLKPPFINNQSGADLATENALAGVAGPGRRIMIPTFARPPQELPLLPILGVHPDAPAEEHILGVDFALEPIQTLNGTVIYGIPIDVEGGSLDAKLVRGITNLKQALVMRVSIERGSDMLYQNLGVQRIIGLGLQPVDLETARFRVAEAIKADPRIAGIRKLFFEQMANPPDAVEMDIEAEVRGFAQSGNVKAQVFGA